MTLVLRVELAGTPGAPALATLVDLVVDALWMHGAVGVATEDLAHGVRLTSSFGAGDPGDADSAASGDGVDPHAVAAVVAALAPDALVTLDADDGAWWDAWRPHARPVVAAGGRVVLAPAWIEPAPEPPVPGGIVVRVDPGRTFGSGAHATTRLVVDALATLALDGARVLDVGCGSGVLAVVAVRLGAAEAVGVDIDAACVEATQANATRNGVEDRVTAMTAPLGDLDGSFDVVVANVLLPVFEALAADIARLAAGPVVVSGMLDGTEGRATAALGAGWRCAERWSDDGWTTALLRRDDLLT